MDGRRSLVIGFPVKVEPSAVPGNLLEPIFERLATEFYKLEDGDYLVSVIAFQVDSEGAPHESDEPVESSGQERLWDEG